MLSVNTWKPEAVLRLATLLFACMLGGAILVDFANRLAAAWGMNPQLVVTVAGSMSFHGAGLVLIHFFLKEHGLTWREAFGFESPNTARSLAMGAVLGIAILPITLSLARLSSMAMQHLGKKPAVQDSVAMLQEPGPIGAKIVIGVFAVLIAPAAEEVLFRGVLYPGIKRLGYPRLALWGTAIAFAAIHGNWMIFVPLTVLAVALTLLYEATGNLLAPILCHAVFNLANYFSVLAVGAWN